SFASFNTKIHQHLTHRFNIDRPLASFFQLMFFGVGAGAI
ncbi:MAG: hypothetical protein ACI9G6_000732, partial [Limisphaerales bacterium]